jgi:hypothetical protein
MGRWFTIAGIIGAVVLCYIVIMMMWGTVTSAAFDTANTINATANAYAYRHTTAGLRFAPLALFIIPSVIGSVAIYIVLRKPNA